MNIKSKFLSIFCFVCLFLSTPSFATVAYCQKLTIDGFIAFRILGTVTTPELLLYDKVALKESLLYPINVGSYDESSDYVVHGPIIWESDEVTNNSVALTMINYPHYYIFQEGWSWMTDSTETSTYNLSTCYQIWYNL